MSAGRPVWLVDEPELQALLNAVLDRFDRQSGVTRHRAIVLPVAEHLPSLARNDANADQTWALLSELAQRGVLTLRKTARRSIYDAEWTGAKVAFTPESEETLRAWLDRPAAESVMQVWRRAVAAHSSAFASSGEALAARRVIVADRTAQEVVAAFARIAGIEGPITLRQLSACAFWGDSKVLDERGELIAASFPSLEIRERPIVVAVHLPAICSGVLFIENQDTYASAVAGAFAAARDLALVYASGFRSSAARIRKRSGALLHYGGPGNESLRLTFERWWFDAAPQPGPLCFWGDLDFAGMHILKTLRDRFGEVSAWDVGYEPMLRALQAGGGHAGHGGARQVDPVHTGCRYADEVLLPAIREWGQFDQELGQTQLQ